MTAPEHAEKLKRVNNLKITIMSAKEFLKECKETRDDFVKIAGQYSISDNLELRTKIDTLLIMYDQACERVRVGSKPETSESTFNLQNVIARYSLDADLINDIPEMIDLGYRMRNGGVTKEEYERYDFLREMFETEFL